MWLRKTYDPIVDDAKKRGVRLLIVVHPLAYQLADDYPFMPQRVFERYCKERGVQCFDPLPALRACAGRGEPVFSGKRNKYGLLDVWHYTAEGHRCVADALLPYLRKLERRSNVASGGAGHGGEPRP
jgi:hypothetical protein